MVVKASKSAADLMAEPVLNHREVARLCKVSTRTVSEWSANGVMPEGMRAEGRRLWNTDAVLTWLRGGCKPVDPDRAAAWRERRRSKAAGASAA